ncbi:hypothetical protein [uncultured Sphingomonas sp.]|uniref:hypothetical protein n=1 Tax=uncultured Sphingomonas sp. TaxID=158754 RepID=UPI0035CC73DA
MFDDDCLTTSQRLRSFCVVQAIAMGTISDEVVRVAAEIEGYVLNGVGEQKPDAEQA